MSLFRIDQLPLSTRPTPGMANTPSVTPLKKTDFPSLSSYQLQNSFLALGGTLSHFPFFGLRVSGLNLSRSCARCPDLCPSPVRVCMHPDHCVWKTLIPRRHPGHPGPLVLTVFAPPPLHRPLSLEGRVLMKTYHLGVSVPSLPHC